MLTNMKKDVTKPEIENRITYQFFSIINSLLPEFNQRIQKKHFFFQKNIDPRLQEYNEALAIAMNDLQQKILQEEAERQQFTVPLYLYKVKNVAIKTVEKMKADRNEFEEKIEAKRNELILFDSQISRDIQTKTLEIANSQGKKIIDQNEKFNQLTNQKAELMHRSIEINRKIDEKCCSCIPRRVAKELRELREVETKLDDVNLQINQLLRQKEDSNQFESQLNELKNRQTKARDELKKLDENYLEQIKVFNQKVTDAQIDFAEKDEEISRMEARYYANISANLMLKIFKTFMFFLRFQNEMQSTYIKKIDKIQKNSRELLGKMSTAKDRLDEFIDQLWCDELQNISARDLYNQYKKMDTDTQVRLLNEGEIALKKLFPDKNSLVKTEKKSFISAAESRLFQKINQPFVIKKEENLLKKSLKLGEVSA